jgi:hypothetical protein
MAAMLDRDYGVGLPSGKPRTMRWSLGLEGIVCKRRDAPGRSGRSNTWLKVKNPASPAVR